LWLAVPLGRTNFSCFVYVRRRRGRCLGLRSRIERNTRGRDFAVGDIHGYVSALLAALLVRQEHDSLGERLADKQAVERIPMQRRKPFDLEAWGPASSTGVRIIGANSPCRKAFATASMRSRQSLTELQTRYT